MPISRAERSSATAVTTDRPRPQFPNLLSPAMSTCVRPHQLERSLRPHAAGRHPRWCPVALGRARWRDGLRPQRPTCMARSCRIQAGTTSPNPQESSQRGTGRYRAGSVRGTLPAYRPRAARASDDRHCQWPPAMLVEGRNDVSPLWVHRPDFCAAVRDDARALTVGLAQARESGGSWAASVLRRRPGPRYANI